jgi:lysyl-tRNA synthetase class 1
MSDMITPHSQDWLDALTEKILAERPQGDLIVASGHSPSGVYHIGTLREIMTANAITWALRRAGRTVRHIDFVDDFDAFRKVPTGIGVPESWSTYLGQPLRVVPDPFECHDSYGNHFLTQLHEGLAAMGAMPDESVSGFDGYRSGLLSEQIATSLDRLTEIKSILTEVGGRQLDENWSPVQILSDKQSLREWRFTDWDSSSRMVSWVDREGKSGQVGIDHGRVKLDWRIDWPARWAKWGVSVEPFGRDHASKGGSYDTGRAMVTQIFASSAPVPVPYEFIITAGETKKMSKSSGNVLTPQDALEVMPVELLRYFVVKSRPGRTLTFDSGLGLYQLVDEFIRERGSEAAGVGYATSVTEQETISVVPFNHLVAVYQAAQGNAEATKDILIRTGYSDAVTTEWSVIERELQFVDKWLEKYAPASVKFILQNTLPKLELSEAQTVLLRQVADVIEAKPEMDAESMHQTVYAASQTLEMKPAEAFQAFYRILLGQDSGPKAGWFLASLAEHNAPWLIARLRLEK